MPFSRCHLLPAGYEAELIIYSVGKQVSLNEPYIPPALLRPSRLHTAGGRNASWSSPLGVVRMAPIIIIFAFHFPEIPFYAALQMRTQSSYYARTFHVNTTCFPLTHCLSRPIRRQAVRALGLTLIWTQSGRFHHSVASGQVQQTLRLLPVGERQWKLSTELELWQASVKEPLRYQ